jgi:hypothetical protein
MKTANSKTHSFSNHTINRPMVAGRLYEGYVGYSFPGFTLVVL